MINVFIFFRKTIHHLHYRSQQRFGVLLHFVSELEKQTTRHSVSTETETKSTTHGHHSLNTHITTGNIMFLGNCIQIQLDKIR